MVSTRSGAKTSSAPVPAPTPAPSPAPTPGPAPAPTTTAAPSPYTMTPFDHILQVVMGQQRTSPLIAALTADGVSTVEDLMSAYTKDEITQLTYVDGNGQTQPVSKGLKGLLHAFRSYVYTTGASVSGDEWFAFTKEDFDKYQISPLFLAHHADLGTSINLPNISTPQASHTRDPLLDFKRGIKRDMTLFPTLKDDKQWYTWQRSLIAIARAQDVYEILEPGYTPPPDQQLVFTEKQKFMYAVFERTLLTDYGKAFVRQYAPTFDAQAIYEDLCIYCQKSTKASLDSSNLMAYITSAKLGDGQWKGTASAFILHWEDQVRKFESLMSDPHDHFTDGQKRAMLQNSVHNIPELRSIKNQADQHKTHSGVDLSYKEYVKLLLSAAALYDAQFTSKAFTKPPRRAVYAHDVNEESFDIDSTSFDIDSDVSWIQAYAASTGKPSPSKPTGKFQPRSRLTSTQWHRLPPSSQTIWDSLPDSSKAIILESHPPRSFPPRSVNLHDLSAHDYLSVMLHDFCVGSDGDTNIPPESTIDHESSQEQHHDNSQDETEMEDSEDTILAHLTKRKDIAPGDLHRVLSSKMAQKPAPKPKPKPVPKTNVNEITIDGKIYRSVNTTKVVYKTLAHRSFRTGALVDRGANGGIAGEDVRIIEKTGRQVDVQGIDNHQINDISIVTAGAVIPTQKGEVIAIMHQYAHVAKGKTIHSSGQLEWYKNEVNDKSVKVGGLQHIQTIDGYVIPINIKSGLPYISMRPFTDNEWDTLPHVILTSDIDWDPSVLDHSVEDDNDWYQSVSDIQDNPMSNLFDEFGDYRGRHVVTEVLIDESAMDMTIFPHQDIVLKAYEYKTKFKDPDYAALQPNFAWLPMDIIKHTFEKTTQFGRMPMSSVLRKHYKSPFPALNVHRRNEALATDTVYSDTPAIDNGAIAAQIFIGTTSLVTDVFGMKSDKQFVNTLEDIIRKRGAPNKLISDRAQVEISKKVLDILRALFIDNWQSEPHHQHQNPAERRYQTVKRITNTIMDRTGSPPYTWLLAMEYVCFVLNHTASAALNYEVPLSLLTGSTTDISPLTCFKWWEPVYYKLDDSDFPSESRELKGHWVGFAESVGHAMTFKVLTDDTMKILYRSNLRTALDPATPNLRVDDILDEKEAKQFVKSRSGADVNGENFHPPMPLIDPDDLIGCTFITSPNEQGEQFRARIVWAVEDHDADLQNHPDHIKFVCSINNDQYEEIMAYNDIIQHIEKDDGEENIWKFKRITAHEGPLTKSHPNWKGSSFNVMIEWENGEITSEPLAVIAKDDPVTCAIYARDNNLLQTPGWKQFKGIAKRQKKLFRMANQAKLRSYRTAPQFKYGFEVPRDYAHAVQLDKRNGNTKWQDAIKLEMSQLDEYNVFEDRGKNIPIPSDYKKIRVHLVFDVKHDGRHKARLVADGHLTDIPLDSVYSGVVSLRGLRLLIFLSELNGLHTWVTDIGNAYLEAVTKERVCIIAGEEFGTLQGHLLIIKKALYGLRTSGLRWHERFADCLRQEGFSPCKAEPDIWMRKNSSVYEYIGVYVDDLAFAMINPEAFTQVLTGKHKFKLKGTGKIEFHLGCDYFRDEHDVLCMAPRKYIDKISGQYEKMFGNKPKLNVLSPLEKGDHPELDTSELLDPTGVQKYQSVIGSLQWAISLGRLDIAAAVMTLSSFRSAPRKGHLERAQRICGYLAKMKHAVIRFRVDEPDYSDVPDNEYDWATSVYGNVQEDIPQDIPEPLGNTVTLTHYVDANLYHDLLTGRSVTGILHFVNQTPIDWYSKKQATVETATYGSEFVAA